jgi:hypothetical protein
MRAESCARPTRSRCDSTTSCRTPGARPRRPARLRYRLAGVGADLAVPGLAHAGRARTCCATMAAAEDAPVQVLHRGARPGVGADAHAEGVDLQRLLAQRTSSVAASAPGRVGSSVTLTLSNSPDFCSRSWKSSSSASVTGVPGRSRPGGARCRSCRCRPSTRRGRCGTAGRCRRRRTAAPRCVPRRPRRRCRSRWRRRSRRAQARQRGRLGVAPRRCGSRCRRQGPGGAQVVEHGARALPASRASASSAPCTSSVTRVMRAGPG